MAFEDLSALARDLGDRADEAADAAFNEQHALAAQERAASDSIVASVAEQHRRELLAAADDDGLRSFPTRPHGRVHDDDRGGEQDDDAPESWLR